MDFCMSVAAQLILDEMNENSSSKNIVLSPMSMTMILNLVPHGSGGETLDQFLHFLDAQDTEDLKSKSKAIMSLLTGNDEEDTQNIQTPSPSHSFDQPMSPNDMSFEDPQQGLMVAGNQREPHQQTPDSYRFPIFMTDWSAQEPILTMSKALWVDHNYPLKASFKDVSHTIYKALIKNVDFQTQSEKVRAEVNSWAENETKGLIKDLLPKDTKLKPPMCLANTLYFKGTWRIPFQVVDTRDEDFHLLNGKTIKVPFMTKTDVSRHPYGSFEDFKLLQLQYYQGSRSMEKRFSMYIFLPHARDGLKSLVQRLGSDPATLHPKKFCLSHEDLSCLWVPKIKFSHKFMAKDVMRAKGLTLPFDEAGANFGNMVSFESSASGNNNNNVYVGMILHKSCVKVDEEGTMAAAATFCETFLTGRGRPPPISDTTFVADHPFLFMIVDDSSSLVVFIGAVLNPISS